MIQLRKIFNILSQIGIENFKKFQPSTCENEIVVLQIRGHFRIEAVCSELRLPLPLHYLGNIQFTGDARRSTQDTLTLQKY